MRRCQVSHQRFSVIETGSHVILSFLADRDPDGWEDEEPEGELADMARVRSELAAGDLRLVYLGWLLALQTDFSEAAAFTGLGGNLEDGVVMPGVGIRPLSWERAVQPSAHTRRPCPSALE